MSNLSLRVPPLAVFAIAATLIWLAGLWLPMWAWPTLIRSLLASLLALSGLLIALVGVRAFRQARTTIHPQHPERVSSLVSNGIYSRTRNPMYLGMLLVLTAIAVWIGQPAGFVVLPVFVWYLTRYQIVAEEQAIAAHFGQQYLDYCQRVRRWI